jgi:hypothetical protein
VEALSIEAFFTESFTDSETNALLAETFSTDSL